jgi:uncharacterized protein YjiS (DUF1127 family)
MRANAAAISAPVRNSAILKVAQAVANIIARVQKYFIQRDNLATLQAMSDRDLKDIGLSRSDIHRITRL